MAKWLVLGLEPSYQNKIKNLFLFWNCGIGVSKREGDIKRGRMCVCVGQANSE